MPENNSSQGRRNPLVRQNHLGRRAPNESLAASLSALAVQRARAANPANRALHHQEEGPSAMVGRRLPTVNAGRLGTFEATARSEHKERQKLREASVAGSRLQKAVVRSAVETRDLTVESHADAVKRRQAQQENRVATRTRSNAVTSNEPSIDRGLKGKHIAASLAGAALQKAGRDEFEANREQRIEQFISSYKQDKDSRSTTAQSARALRTAGKGLDTAGKVSGALGADAAGGVALATSVAGSGANFASAALYARDARLAREDVASINRSGEYTIRDTDKAEARLNAAVNFEENAISQARQQELAAAIGNRKKGYITADQKTRREISQADAAFDDIKADRALADGVSGAAGVAGGAIIDASKAVENLAAHAGQQAAQAGGSGSENVGGIFFESGTNLAQGSTQGGLDTAAGELIDRLGRGAVLGAAKKAGGRAARRAENVLRDENKNVAFEARSNAYGRAVARTDDKMARRIQKFARSAGQQQKIKRVAGRRPLASRTQRL